MLGFFFKLRNYSIRTVQMSTEYCGGVSNYKQHFLEMRGSLLVEPSVGFFFFLFFTSFPSTSWCGDQVTIM